MLALQITSMKHFMTQLLDTDIFDIFLLQEASITMANTVTIDGLLHRNFYSPQEADSGQVPDYKYTPWSDIKKLCYNLIKGKHTPLAFRFILSLKPELTAELLGKNTSEISPDQIEAMVLTIHYDGTRTILTTGCSYKTFVLSKEPDQIWDRVLVQHLTARGVAFEQL